MEPTVETNGETPPAFADPLIPLLGAVVAGCGLLAPFFHVTFKEAIHLPRTVTGIDALESWPLLWIVVAACAITLVLAVKATEERHRVPPSAICLVALVGLVTVVHGFVAGYEDMAKGKRPDHFLVSDLLREVEPPPAEDQGLAETLVDPAKTQGGGKKSAPGGDMPGMEGEEDPMGEGKTVKRPKQGKDEGGKGTVAVTRRVARMRLAPGSFLVVLGLLVVAIGAIPLCERIIAFVEGLVIAVLLAGMLGLALYLIQERNWPSDPPRPLVWGDTLLRAMVIWLGLLGASFATRTRAHISIEIVSRFAPRAISRWVSVLAHVAAAGTCTVLAQVSADWLDFRMIDWHDDPTPWVANPELGLEMPEWFIYTIVPVTLLLMAVRFSLWAFRGVSTLRRSEDPVEEDQTVVLTCREDAP